MPKMVNIKLKSFEEIVDISVPYTVLVQEYPEFHLIHKNSLNKYHSLTSATFPALLVQFCGKVISVVDKADYEYADDYCLYYKDFKIKISDWMIDNN